MDNSTKSLLKLFEEYIDTVQARLSIQDYRGIESETDNVIALLIKLKFKYGIK